MGNTNTVPKVRANDLKRLCGDENCGWLNKTGLTSTKFQKRWCAIHNLKLYYFNNPRSDEPNGVVELRGAIVTRSKNVKMAIEIETGALVSTKGIEKRTYIFTPEIGDGDLGVSSMDADDKKAGRRKKEKEYLEKWLGWLQKETARTFTPGVA